MKVCMLSFSECDQYYITARRVAKALVDAGHDVTIIAYRGVLDTCLEREEYSNGYKIIRVDLVIARILRIGLINLITDKVLRRHRYSQNTIQITSPKQTTSPSRRTIVPKAAYDFLSEWMYSLWYRAMLNLLYIDYYYHVYNVAKRERAQVYHAHDLVTLPVAWLCSRAHKARLVYDMHELWIDREKKRSFLNRFLMLRLESFLIRRTDANTIAGYSSAKELVRRYKIPEPVVLLNTPLYREYKPSTLYRDNLGIPAGQRILLYAGMINIYRGIEEMIQSLKFLPDCCLVLHGFGPNYYISSLHGLIANNGVRDRVYFFGPVPFDEVSTYAMSADVGLVLHKNVGLNYYYVSPNKLFECMAAGLPVVGSNFPDIKRFVEGYMFGVTCNPDSPQEIAEAVRYILADNSRYDMMRHNALQAAKVLNWENESRKLVAIYDNLGKLVVS
jgi:glycosyltransferase involved in cell wall biosynthesis